MALANYRTTHAQRRLIDAAPVSHRLVLLKALNPALAAELSYVEAHPDAAVLRAGKLDADTAVELIGYVTGHVALVSLTKDTRVAVREAAHARCASLGVARAVSANTPLAQRTARALASDDPLAALGKMSSIDDGVLLEWLRTGEHNDTLVAMLAPSRHDDVCFAAHRAAVELDLVEVVLNHADARKLSPVLTSWEQPVNRAVVEALLRMQTERLSSPVLPLGLAIDPLAEPLVANLPAKLRVMLDVASADELRAYVAAVEPDPQRPWLHDSEVAARLLGVRTSRLAAVALETLDTLSDQYAERVAQHVLSLEGITTEQRRRCLVALGYEIHWMLRKAPLSHDDAVCVADALAAKPEAAAELVSRLDSVKPENAGELFDLLCERVDGLGRAVSRSKGWGLPRFLDRAALVLDQDHAAWSVLLSQLGSYGGPPDELLAAASVAGS